LQGEKDQHANGGSHEQDTTTNALDHERGHECPSQIPDLEDAIYEELGGRIGDPNAIEDLVQVVRDKTIPRPL